MDKKALVSHMNSFKTERRILKDQICVIDDFISYYNVKFILKNLLIQKETYLKEYRAYGICIDAAMDILDYQNDKVLSVKQLSEINSAVSTFLLPVEIVEYINEINKEYKMGFSYSIIDYLRCYLYYLGKKLLNTKCSKEDINAYNKMSEEKILEYTKKHD